MMDRVSVDADGGVGEKYCESCRTLMECVYVVCPGCRELRVLCQKCAAEHVDTCHAVQILLLKKLVSALTERVSQLEKGSHFDPASLL